MEVSHIPHRVRTYHASVLDVLRFQRDTSSTSTRCRSPPVAAPMPSASAGEAGGWNLVLGLQGLSSRSVRPRSIGPRPKKNRRAVTWTLDVLPNVDPPDGDPKGPQENRLFRSPAALELPHFNGAILMTTAISRITYGRRCTFSRERGVVWVGLGWVGSGWEAE
jgi:hypothetical protein